MVRAFIAIDLPASLQEALSLVQEPLHKAPGRLAIVDPSLLHITLKFLGELSPDQVARVIEELKSLEFPAYPVSIRGISANNPTRPRVIWAKVQDEGKTAALAGLIDSALETIGVSRETRPFRPHITIARVKEFHPGIPAAIFPLSGWIGGEIDVSRIVLKKSTLTPRGPIYETLAEVAL